MITNINNLKVETIEGYPSFGDREKYYITASGGIRTFDIGSGPFWVSNSVQN